MVNNLIIINVSVKYYVSVIPKTDKNNKLSLYVKQCASFKHNSTMLHNMHTIQYTKLPRNNNYIIKHIEKLKPQWHKPILLLLFSWTHLVIGGNSLKRSFQLLSLSRRNDDVWNKAWTSMFLSLLLVRTCCLVPPINCEAGRKFPTGINERNKLRIIYIPLFSYT